MSRNAQRMTFRTMKRPLQFVDMFCGIGGFHIAMQNLGAKCVFACDIDKEARKAYHANFGMHPHGDITKLDLEKIPDHDVFCAGFPCQPFSIIGARGGLEDTRGTLFFDIARILKAKRPRAIMLENVRQLKTHNNGRTFGRIAEVLQNLGYGIKHAILDARNFGLPQKRERIIIVGMLSGIERFEFPQNKEKMTPLSDILETDPENLARHYASERIMQRRKALHASKIKPSIWHENKGGNISSHPFSCALRANASYNYLLVNGERRLTPREQLRLQGFPDDFRIVCNDSNTRKQAGNAVPIPMILAVGKEIQNAIN